GSDQALLEKLLHEGSCVTLVGPSGVGKTSLARAAAAAWPSRSVWVDLASLVRGDQVAGAVARAAGAPLNENDGGVQLLAALKAQALLLVLDNAEHVVQACAELAAQLRSLPQLHLLITSQVPLAIAGERVQRLEPLHVPQSESATTIDLDDGAIGL